MIYLTPRLHYLDLATPINCIKMDEPPKEMEAAKQDGVPASTYLIISGVSLIAAVAIGYYYFHNLHSGTEKMDDRVFYLVLVLFGIAVSALIFGIMHSYATLSGVQAGVTYKLAGPVVGVILTVLGGFIIPKGSDSRILSIRVFDQDNKPLSKGMVTVSFPDYQRQQQINDNGMAVFPDIPADQLRKKIMINISSDGFAGLTMDTLLSNFEPVNIVLHQSKVMRIEGTVKDAADRPISDVTVTVDGTPYFAKTLTNGTFEIPLPDYHFGDRITLVTSHPAYEDKERQYEIESGEINQIEIVLNPLPLKKIKHKTP